MKDIKIQILLLIFVIAVISLGSCQKLVEVDTPPTSVSGENVYENDATAISAVTSLYSNISKTGALNGTTFLSGLSSDELTLWSGVTNDLYWAYYKNELSAIGNSGSELWGFNNIYTANEAIEKITNSKNIAEDIKRQLLGEAKFVRAYLYFYLVNLYGDVPLILTTDHKVNSKIPRSSKQEVYKQIISDLKEAQSLLSTDYLNGNLKKYSLSTTERVRPTKWAATALLARTYLYVNDWMNSEVEASSVIDQKNMYDTVSLSKAFLKNTKEAIWQLQPVIAGRNTEEARVFILPLTGPNNAGSFTGNPVYLSEQLLNSFELGDQRRVRWIDSVVTLNPKTTYYYASKYKQAADNSPVSEYQMILRITEQYLIRAEARAQLSNLNGARSDLNIIRVRAGLASTSTSDKTLLLKEILKERQKEFFVENGHRWLDLKRTGNIDSVMTVVTSQKSNTSVWKSYQQWYPLPIRDLQLNGGLIQNEGY